MEAKLRQRYFGQKGVGLFDIYLEGELGWHHRLNRHEFEQALGVGDGQGSLACCSPGVSHSVKSDSLRPK